MAKMANLVAVVVCFFLLASQLPGFSGAVEPGFTFTLSQDGLTYIVKTAMSVVRAEWSTVAVPGQQGTVTEPILGTIDYDVKNITLLPNPILPDPTITLISPSNMIIQVTGATFGVVADFDYKAYNWSSLQGNGTINVGISNLTVTIDLSITANDGHPNLNVTNCVAEIGEAKIVIGGGAAWMQDWINILKKTIKSEIEAEIASLTTYYVNQVGDQLLASLPMREPILGIAEIDFSLVRNPYFAPSSGISFFCKGEVYNLQNPVEAPFSPASMPYTLTNQMLQLFVSDYVLNTASFALYKGGYFVYNLTDQDLPSWSPLRLNTSTWSWILPELASKYPNMAMMASVVARQSPVANFSSSGIAVLAIGAIEFMVLPPGSSPVNVFTLGLNASTTIGVNLVNGTTVTGKIDAISANVSLLWSNVGSIPVSLLSSGIQMLINALVPMANSFLATGYPLPGFPGLTLIDPKIGYGQNFMYVSTSITYQPPIWLFYVKPHHRIAAPVPSAAKGKLHTIAIN